LIETVWSKYNTWNERLRLGTWYAMMERQLISDFDLDPTPKPKSRIPDWWEPDEWWDS
jgi:hypothetical protein